jgi:hypothetical protein
MKRNFVYVVVAILLVLTTNAKSQAFNAIINAQLGKKQGVEVVNSAAAKSEKAREILYAAANDAALTPENYLQILVPYERFGLIEFDKLWLTTDYEGFDIVWEQESEKFSYISGSYDIPWRSNASGSKALHMGSLDSCTVRYLIPEIIKDGKYYFWYRASKYSNITQDEMVISLVKEDGVITKLVSFKAQFYTGDWNIYRIGNPLEISLNNLNQPKIRVEPSELDFGEIIEGSVETIQKSFLIKNAGSGTLECTIHSSSENFNVTPTTITVAPGNSENVNVSCQVKELNTGEYTEYITISSNAAEALKIPLLLKIIDPPCGFNVSPSEYYGTEKIRDTVIFKISSTETWDYLVAENANVIQVQKISNDELFVYAEHFHNSTLTDTLTIFSSCSSIKIPISKPPYCMLSLREDSVELTDAEQYFKKTITKNHTYSVRTPEHITYISSRSIVAPFTDELTFKIDQNTSKNQRDGKILIETECGKTVSLYVFQEGKPETFPVFECNVDRLDFGQVYIDQAPIQKIIQIKNTGKALLEVTASRENSVDFLFGQAAIKVAPGDSASISVTFNPAFSGIKLTKVVLKSNAALKEYVIEVRGEAVYTDEFMDKILIDSLLYNTLDILTDEFWDEISACFWDAVDYQNPIERPLGLGSTSVGFLALLLQNRIFGAIESEEKILAGLKFINEKWKTNKAGIPSRYASQDGSAMWILDDYSLTDMGIFLAVLNCIYNDTDEADIKNEIAIFYKSLDLEKNILIEGTDNLWHAQRENSNGFSPSGKINEELILLNILKEIYPDKYTQTYDSWLDINSIPKAEMHGYELLTDINGVTQPAFIQALLATFVQDFKTNNGLIQYLKNQFVVERLTHGTHSFNYSKSAGSCREGYCISRIGEDSPYFYPSSQIFYLNVDEKNVKYDILNLWRSNDATYEINGKKHLWVYTNDGYEPKELIAIDLLPGLLPLARLKNRSWVDGLNFGYIDLFDHPATPELKFSTESFCKGSTVDIEVKNRKDQFEYTWQLEGVELVSKNSNASEVTLKIVAEKAKISVFAENEIFDKKSETVEKLLEVISSIETPLINGPETSVQEGEEIEYSIGNFSGDINYNWNYSGQGALTPKTENVILKPVTSGILTLTAVAECGEARAEMQITVEPAIIELDTANLQLAPIIGTIGDTIIVPITATMKAVAGTIKLKYDSTSLSFIGFSNWNSVLLRENLLYSVDESIITIVFLNSSEIHINEENICQLSFKIIAENSVQSELLWERSQTSLISNNGDYLPIVFENGSIEIEEKQNFFNGFFGYHTKATPLVDLQVEVQTPYNDKFGTTTDDSGFYQFPFSNPGIYTLNPDFSKLEKDGAIDIRDVLFYLYYVAVRMELSDIQILAGDMDANGFLDIRDVVLLLEFVVENNIDTNFVFTNQQVPIESKTKSIVSLVLQKGDADGSLVKQKQKSTQTNNLHPNGNIVLQEGNIFQVPLVLDQHLSGLAGLQISVDFDTTFFQVDSVVLQTPGIKSVNKKNGSIKAAVVSTEEISLVDTFMTIYLIPKADGINSIDLDGNITLIKTDLTESNVNVYYSSRIITTGISNAIIENQPLKIFPNPIKGGGTVNFNTEKQNIKIFTANGMLINYHPNKINSFQAPSKPGIYFVKSENQTTKLVVY